MIKNNNIAIKDLKQRLTAFVDPVLVKRAKVRGALEGLTLSEVVEKALEEHAPRIENGNGRNIHLKFLNSSPIGNPVSGTDGGKTKKVAKHTMSQVVP
jgi:hypothetical protein